MLVCILADKMMQGKAKILRLLMQKTPQIG
jgi:hypothetical protein